MGSVRENIRDIRARIDAALERSGRRAEDITLVCVTKTRSVEEIAEVLEAGEFQLGENRVQELLDKYEKVQDIASSLPKKPNIVWNLIGHLQRNKVKYIAEKVSLIHSVDSFRLAEELDARAASAGVRMRVLVQVNAGEEANKSGVAFSDCRALVNEITDRLHHIDLSGMMVVVPVADDPEEVRGYFRDAKRTFDAIAKERGGAETGFIELSMGMTHDFEVAIEEGSTMVRIGTAIFGSRD